MEYRSTSIDAVLDPDEAIEIGYEAATPWLLPHSVLDRVERESPGPAQHEALRSLMTGSSA